MVAPAGSGCLEPCHGWGFWISTALASPPCCCCTPEQNRGWDISELLQKSCRSRGSRDHLPNPKGVWKYPSGVCAPCMPGFSAGTGMNLVHAYKTRESPVEFMLGAAGHKLFSSSSFLLLVPACSVPSVIRRSWSHREQLLMEVLICWLWLWLLQGFLRCLCHFSLSFPSSVHGAWHKLQFCTEGWYHQNHISDGCRMKRPLLSPLVFGFSCINDLEYCRWAGFSLVRNSLWAARTM